MACSDKPIRIASQSTLQRKAQYEQTNLTGPIRSNLKVCLSSINSTVNYSIVNSFILSPPLQASKLPPISIAPLQHLYANPNSRLRDKIKDYLELSETLCYLASSFPFSPSFSLARSLRSVPHPVRHLGIVRMTRPCTTRLQIAKDTDKRECRDYPPTDNNLKSTVNFTSSCRCAAPDLH